MNGPIQMRGINSINMKASLQSLILKFTRSKIEYFKSIICIIYRYRIYSGSAAALNNHNPSLYYYSSE